MGRPKYWVRNRAKRSQPGLSLGVKWDQIWIILALFYRVIQEKLMFALEYYIYFDVAL